MSAHPSGGVRVRVWFGAASSAAAEAAARGAYDAASRGDGPGGVLASWKQAGVRFLGHRNGPAVKTEAEAMDWIRTESAELEARAPREFAPRRRADEVVFAIVYAHFDAPTSQPHTLEALGAHLLSEGSLGMAFVACRGASRETTPIWLQRAFVLWAFLVMAVGLFGVCLAWDRLIQPVSPQPEHPRGSAHARTPAPSSSPSEAGNGHVAPPSSPNPFLVPASGSASSRAHEETDSDAGSDLDAGLIDASPAEAADAGAANADAGKEAALKANEEKQRPRPANRGAAPKPKDSVTTATPSGSASGR